MAEKRVEPNRDLARLRFDTVGHDFYVDGRRRTHLGRHAKVQIAVFSAIEMARWAPFVPAVLKNFPGPLGKESLKQAIKGLNRRQTAIAFHEDGDGVRWNWRRPVRKVLRAAPAPKTTRRSQANARRKPKPR
jgi:hypothetical protein